MGEVGALEPTWLRDVIMSLLLLLVSADVHAFLRCLAYRRKRDAGMVVEDAHMAAWMWICNMSIYLP